MTPSQAEAASHPAGRSTSIDALRGVALFGVLIVNAETAFRSSLFAHYTHYDVGDGALDLIVFLAYGWLFEWKAIAIFSLLFGAGLAALWTRAESAGQRPARLLLGRLGVLAGLGLMHVLLVWNGDILLAYALCGAALLPVLRAPLHVSFFVATALLALSCLPLPWPAAFPIGPALADHNQRALAAYGRGGWAEILSFRLYEARAHMAPLLLQTTPKIGGLMALGAGLWRVGVLREPGRFRSGLRGFAIAGVLLGSIAFWLELLAIMKGWRHGVVWDLVSAFGGTPLGLTYGAALLVWFEGPRMSSSRSVQALAGVGRMGLSNYLLQSVVLSLVFYGYGFGLFGSLGTAATALIVLPIYVGQVVLSCAWLARWKLGPLEWLVRSVAPVGAGVPRVRPDA